jgi:hypothetical protein
LRLAVEFEFQDFDAAREQDQLLQLAETDNLLGMPKVELGQESDAALDIKFFRKQYQVQQLGQLGASNMFSNQHLKLVFLKNLISSADKHAQRWDADREQVQLLDVFFRKKSSILVREDHALTPALPKAVYVISCYYQVEDVLNSARAAHAADKFQTFRQVNNNKLGTYLNLSLPLKFDLLLKSILMNNKCSNVLQMKAESDQLCWCCSRLTLDLQHLS